MKRFKEIVALVADYRKELVSNFFFNVLNAIFSLFTFLSVVPFLYILFRVDSGEKVDKDKANPLWYWLSENLNAFIAENGQAAALAWMCVMIVILALVKNLVNYISLFSIAKVRTAISRDLREKVYYKIMDLPISFFSGERKEI